MSKSPETLNFEKETAWAPRCSHSSGRFRLWVVGLLLVATTAACVSYKGTGLYAALSSGEKKKILEEIKKNWQDYDVYCDGPVQMPGALIFDPKDDDRNLIGYRYIKLTKENYVNTAIVWMEYQMNFDPTLYRIFDEEKNFYGYVLVAGDLPVTKRLDEKTLEVSSFQSKFFLP